MAGRTDVGKKRKNNEDSLYFSEEEGFAIVADGMGGLEAGEIASQMVVQGMAAHFIKAHAERKATKARPMEQLGRITVSCRDWLASVNADLYLAAKSRERRHKMGSTIALIAECADHVVVGNLGDSRVYRFREGKLTQLSVDHSWAAESPDTVMEGEMKRAKKFVTRALGIQARIEPEFLVEKVQRGDLFLLCSDGLMEELNDEELSKLLGEVKDDLWKGTEALVAEANGRGGADNVSVVLARAAG
ncbi:MAG: protein phosphatase 2C domain-containing protein [Planctomycetes bacterium]|nr:protein phosphatase 2C domain-containing protein [Planctomycetota bacterium]